MNDYSRAEVAVVRRIEKALSDILSDKYDCKVKIRYLPEEYGDGKLAENERVHCICDKENGHRYVIVKEEPSAGGEGHERTAANHHCKLRMYGT